MLDAHSKQIKKIYLNIHSVCMVSLITAAHINFMMKSTQWKWADVIDGTPFISKGKNAPIFPRDGGVYIFKISKIQMNWKMKESKTEFINI